MRIIRLWKGGPALLAAAQIFSSSAGEPASVLFQRGIYAEEIEGNLKTAIEVYRKIAEDQKAVRPAAAQAQFRLALCLQKQGNRAEAIAALRELQTHFPEQGALMLRTRRELAALGVPSSELRIRKVMIQGAPAYEGVHETRLGRVAADGRHFSFSDWRSEWGYRAWLRVRDLQTGAINDVVDPYKGGLGTWNSIWSPDGQYLAYACGSTNGGLAPGLRISRPDGSAARTLIDFRGKRDQPGPLDWSADGRSILGATRTNLVLISVADGSHRIIKKLEHSLDNSDFLQGCARFSPDGRYVAYAYAPDENDPFQRDIYVVATDGSSESVVVQHPAHDYEPVWTPDGNAIVFASNRTGANGLWLLPMADGKAHGELTLIVQTMGRIHPKDFTKDGLFYYDVHLGDSDLFVVDLDAESSKALSTPVRLSVPYEGWVSAPSWSPDGEQIAFIARPNFTRGALDDYTRTLLCIHNTTTGQTRELATPPALKISEQPQWSAESRELLVTARNPVEKANGIYRIDVHTGAASALLMAPSKTHINGAFWTRDGKSLIYNLNQGWGSTNRTVIRDVETGAERELHRWQRIMWGMALSPDGQQLAVLEMMENENRGGPEAVIRLIPLQGGEPRDVIRFPKGQRALGTICWTADGKQILYAQGRHGVGLVYFQIDVRGGSPTELGITNGIGHAVFSLHPNGKRMVFAGNGRFSELWAIEGLDIPAALLPGKIIVTGSEEHSSAFR